MSAPPPRKTPPAPCFHILDLGTSTLRLVQVRMAEGAMEYSAHLTAPAQGMRKGAVTGLAPAAEAMQALAAEMELRTGVPVERVFLSLTGAQIKGLTSQGGLPLNSRSREVTREDARRVLDMARAMALPDDRQILHVIPQEFVLDRQGGIHEPVGMLASRLEARIYALTVATSAKDNLVLAANHAGLEVEELIFAPLASAEACLETGDRFAGVAMVELGAGTTGILVYSQGSLVHAASVAIGGDHFTNDISICLNTPVAEAERLKLGYGAATGALAGGDGVSIEVPGMHGQPSRLLPRRQLCECIEPRARELTRLIAKELATVPGLAAGILMSGGGQRLQGLPEMLAEASGLAVRSAVPSLIEGMPQELAEPEFAFMVGACFYAHRLMSRRQRAPGWWEKLRARLNDLAD
ncbi:MAG TPA: cell division protein FtsA [Terriglobales bacterium]|jgi:cell division protein FtsA